MGADDVRQWYKDVDENKTVSCCYREEQKNTMQVVRVFVTVLLLLVSL